DADSKESASSTPAANSSADASKDSAKDFVVADTKPAEPTSDAPVFPSAAPSMPKQAAPETKPAAPESKPAESAPAAPSTATAATSANVAANLAREQQQNMQAPHAALRSKYTGAPYSFNLKDADLKDFFRAIAE